MSDLTPEVLKQKYAEAVAKGNTFETRGVSPDEARAYLKSPDGIKYLTQLNEAARDLSIDELRERAIGQITSGRELPRMETIDESLVKIVPKGNTPTGHSPYWAKEADLNAAVKEGKNLSQHFALPVGSESPQYDVYKITPKAPTEVFVNTVAPTTELHGQVIKPGGATQYLTPNRNLYEPAEFVKTVDNRLHLPLQKSADHAAPHSTGARTFANTVKGAGIAGTVYGAYDAKGQIDAAIDTARSNREQWVRGSEEAVNQGTKAVVTGAAATVGAVPGAAFGTLTSPVTGPVGPVVGGLATGGAAAVGAEKLYEDSRLQQFSKYLGGKGGDLLYEHVSKEGRLLGQVNGIKQDLQTATDPAQRAQLQTRLTETSEKFSTEAERNGRTFEGRAGIDKAWEQTHATYPKVDKDDVTGSLVKHMDAGKRPADAAR